MLATIVVISHFTKVSFGVAAVDLFFVLSGYWIYRMYHRKYSRYRHPAAVFLASRFMRLLPVFLLFNGLALAVHYAFRDGVVSAQKLIDIVPNILVLGYASLPQLPLVPAWSLDIEMQFYLLFPLLYAAMGAAGRAVPALVLGALAISGVCACALRQGGVTVFPFIGFFMVGASAARIAWHPSRSLVAAALLLSVLVLACFLAMPALRGVAIHDLDAGKFSWNALLNFAITLALTPVILTSVHNPSGPRDRMLGDMSYVVYCSHWSAVLLAEHFVGGLSHLQKAPFIAGLLLASYLLSYLVTIYLDLPLSRLREAWVARGTPASAASIPQT